MTDTAQPDLDALLSHATFVRGLARALLRGDRHVDDVVQETWLAAVRGGPTRAGQERAWLSRVVRNVAYGVLRREGRRSRREATAARSVAVPGTGEIAVREETRRKLLERLLAVSEPSRSALLLRYYEGLPPREVARSLGVPVETARTRIKRGLIELRRALDAENEGDRRLWMTGLLPLAGWAVPAGAGAATSVGAGAAVAWAGILALGLLTFLALRDGEQGPGGGTRLGTPARPAPRLVGRAPLRARSPTPKPGRSRIYGRVHRKGVGLGARVWIQRTGVALATRIWTAPTEDPDAAHVLHTDADGHFSHEGLAVGTYAIRIETEDGVGMSVSPRVWANGQHVRGDFDVPDLTHSVQGRALWKSGTSFRGMVGYALRTGMPPFPGGGDPWITSTCRDGTFRLASVPPSGRRRGELRLCFTTSGGPGIYRSIRPPATGEPVHIVVDEGLLWWHGTVEDEHGHPLAGIPFITYFRPPGGEVNGSHQSRSGPEGQLTALVSSEGCKGPRCVDTCYLQPGPWTFQDEAIRLGNRGGRLSGVVRTPEGEHVRAGIRVRVVSMGAGPGPLAQQGTTSTIPTDADGHYEVRLPAGRVFAYAAGQGLGSPGIGTLRRDAAVAQAQDLQPGGHIEQDLELVAAGTLSGRLLDRAGAPIPGALLSLLQVRKGKNHRAALLLPTRVASNQDGRFQLDVSPDFEVRIRASHPEFIPCRSAAFSLESGGAAEITLRMDRPRRVVVRVRDAESDEPIIGATVTISRRGDTGGWFGGDQTWARSNAAGNAAFAGAPGALAVRAQAQGYERDSDWQPLEAALTPGPFRATLTLRRGLRLAGQVLRPDGAPATKARVSMQPLSPNSGGWSPNGGAVDQRGRFTAGDLRRGAYRLKAWAQIGGERHQAEQIVTESDDEIVLTLKRHARQKGEWLVRVRTPGGQPGAAAVSLYSSQLAGHGGSCAGSEWSVDGAAYLRGRGGKRFFLIVTPSLSSGFGTAVLGPFSSWKGGAYEASLAPARVIAGIVRNADGSPAPSLRLEAVPDLDDDQARFPQAVVRSARTDAEGRFRLHGLGRHPLRIRFQTQSDGWTPPSIALGPQEDQPALVLAGHFDPILLKVLDASGHPAVRARVQVYPAEGPLELVADASAGADGVLRVQGLDPTHIYRLLVEGDWSAKLAPHVDARWSPRDATVHLQPARLTRGEVRTPTGRLARRARVYRRGAYGSWRMVQEHPRMPFELHLADGRHELVALTLAARPDEKTTGTWIEAGALDLVLPFDPGPTLWLRCVPWGAGQSGSLEIQREGTALKRPRNVHIQDDGTSECYRLEAEVSYSVFGRFGQDPEHAETYVQATGLRTSEQGLRLSVKPGERLDGRISGGAGADYSGHVLYVHIGSHRVWGRIQPDGRFSVPGLPPGEVRVEVRTGYESAALTRSFRCRPGTYAQLRLE